MKRILLLLMITTGIHSFVAAQDSCVYYLTPDVQESKEIMLKSTNEMFDLNMKIGVKWLQLENKIQLLFDRKSVNGNDLFFLLLPMSDKKEPIKTAVDCKSQKKTLWSKLKSDDTKHTQFFVTSENLKIEDYKNCFRLLANNNEEEFVYELNETEDFTIDLPGFLVVKTEKRPWYTFSKRDKKLQFRTKPLTLVVEFEKKIVPDTCEMAEKVVAFIEAHQNILAEDSEELLDAQKKKNCILFGLIKDKIRRNFIECNDRCERYAKACEEIALAVQDYKEAFETIFKEDCVAPARAASTSGCTLSESELSSINNRLKNLQMKINVKKKDGASTDGERKDYRAIKTAVTAKLTPECRKQYKNAVDAFNSYCTNIESLF